MAEISSRIVLNAELIPCNANEGWIKFVDFIALPPILWGLY